MRYLPLAALVLLVGCSTSSSRIVYTQDGSDMIATLSDGTAIRVPCLFTRSRQVTRMPQQEVDDCEMALEHRQYVQERQALVDAREQRAAESASP